MSALPINVKVALGDTGTDGSQRYYAQIEIGPGDIVVTVYESLIDPGTAVIDIDHGGSEPGATPVSVAINDTYVAGHKA